MSRSILAPCPECQETVVWPMNDTLLDYPAEPWSDEACWTVERVINFPGFKNRTRLLAMKNRGPSYDGYGRQVGHRLHEHQPPQSIVRQGKLPWAVRVRGI